MIDADHLLILGIPPYIFFSGAGIAVTYPVFMLLSYFKKQNIIKNTIAFCMGGVGLIIGAKILGILSNWFYLIQIGEAITWENFLVGGIVFYGGLIGFVSTFLLTLSIQQEPLRENQNIVAVCIPLFHTFARIGCFFAGCCYGKEAHTFLSIPYATSSLAMTERIPVQLIESGFDFVLFLVLLMLSINKRRRYQLILIYFASYAAGRFFLEFLRGDLTRGFIGVLSTSQVVSLIILSLIALRIIYIKTRNPTV
jgi:phosphatidylglycerol:prolipoprotein diacylglycerol transferase